MKTATIEDLQLHLSTLEEWLAEGESIEITKQGKPYAVLTLQLKDRVKWEGTPFDKMTDEQRKAYFDERFGNPPPVLDNPTRIVEMLIEERGE
ncbi:MAG: type II toxin-antitoxin system Phd/YefM family antitoxin [Candidatus Methylacidiphilales bacterium]|nr:hypothetical protein [Candidatus Methylacidiphilales bacterium]